MSKELSPEIAALFRVSRNHERGPTPTQKSRIRQAVLVSAATAVAAKTATEAAHLVPEASSTLVTHAAKSGLLSWLALSKISIVGAFALGFGASVIAIAPWLSWSVNSETTAGQNTTPPSTVQSDVGQSEVSSAVSSEPRLMQAKQRDSSIKSSTPASSASVSGSGSQPLENSAREIPKAVPEPLNSANIRRNSNPLPELRLLRNAQQALQRGQAEDALRRLKGYSDRHGSGQFHAERIALQVFAHCQLGQVQAARRQAENLLAVAPHSPLAPRVRASCAFSSDSSKAKGSTVDSQ